jgi:hypothetical protein
MISKMVKRVEKLETQKKAQAWVAVRLLKFAMDVRRMPPDKRKMRSDYKPRKLDFETCVEFGKRNIKAIEAVRTARLKGKEISKIIRAIV